MDLKKTKKADLERSRGTFIQIGLVIALSIVLIAFDYSSKENESANYMQFPNQQFDMEETISTIREPAKPAPIKQLQIAEILTIVDNGETIDIPIFFDPEADGNTVFDPDAFQNLPEVFVEKDFVIVEDMPKFNGGDPQIEFRKFIAKNVRYPEIAEINGVSGIVMVQFVIDKKGNLVEAQVINSVDPALDKEALRVIESSPLWEPGKQREKPVRVIYKFPIGFLLANK